MRENIEGTYLNIIEYFSSGLTSGNRNDEESYMFEDCIANKTTRNHIHKRQREEHLEDCLVVGRGTTRQHLFLIKYRFY